jgi:hypothetical protein
MKHGGFMKNDGFQKDFFWIELWNMVVYITGVEVLIS